MREGGIKGKQNRMGIAHMSKSEKGSSLSRMGEVGSGGKLNVFSEMNSCGWEPD